MKISFLRYFLAIALLLSINNLFAQSPSAGTVAFTTTPPTVNLAGTTGVRSYVPVGATAANGQGLDFAIRGTNGTSLQILSSTTTSNNLTFTRSSAAVNITEVRIRSAATGSATSTALNTPGDQFRITSMNIMLIANGSAPLTFSGYRNGVLVATQNQTFTTTAKAGITFTTTFSDIDDLVITGFGTGAGTAAGEAGLRIDDIVIAAVAAPSITYTTPQVYTAGTTIPTLAPVNAGGSVFGQGFATSTNFKAITDTYEVDVDASGNVYSVNGTNGDLFKYNSAGTGGTINTTNLVSPSGLGVDGLGNIYVADFVGGSVFNVLKFSNTGTLLSTTTGFSSPYGIAFDSDNNAYVVDSGTGTVIKIAAGTTTKTTYITGLTSPYGIAIDPSDNIYVGSNVANTIVKIAAGTTTPTAFIAAGAGLNGPRHLDADAAGNIYVADFGNNLIKKITAAGTISSLIPTAEVSNPRGVAIDPTGILYFANNGTGNVKKALSTGSYYIDKALPAGLVFDDTDGEITGTPTEPMATTVYTITAYNISGSSSTTLSITVNTPAPTVAPVTICGTGSPMLTAVVTPTGGTYNWYTASTGGVLLQSSTTNTYTTFVGGTTTFYVSYVLNGITSPTRTAVTVTVTQEVSSSITAPALSWPFDGNTNDISGNANHGLPQNSPALTADRNNLPNSAYTFNGTSTYVVATTGFNPTPLIFSLSIWFKTTTAGGMLVGMGGNQISASNATHDRHIYMSNTGQLYFGIYDGAVKTVNTTTTYADGLWHHAVATCGTTNGLRLYVDGTLQSSPLAYTTPQNTGGFWRIGGDNVGGWTGSSGNYFSGVLDDFVVYNRELTTTESADNDLNQYTFASSYCANNPLTIGAPAITGATYAWVDNSNPANTSNTNPAVFSSATTSSYQLTVTNGSCVSVSTVTPITPTFTWKGGGTTADNLATNWYNTTTGVANVAPSFSGTESLVIPGGATPYPILTNNRSIYSLTIGAGASLSLATFNLFVGCNVINNNNTTNGIINSSINSKLTFNGTLKNQAYIGTNTSFPVQLGSLTIANTNATSPAVTFSGGAVDVSNLLTITSGNMVITPTATVKLKSTSTITASVPSIPSAYSISGNVTVERYFTGGALSNRGWRLLSSPVNNSATIPATSSATFNFSSLKTNLLITGVGGSAAGFDQPAGYTANGSTILFYNTSTALFTWPTSLLTTPTRPVGTGFYFYFRGNNTTSVLGKVVKTGTFVAPEANVVGLQTGTLNQQNFNVTLSNAFRGYNLVGNPYPSTINITNAALSGTTGFVYTYSPSGTSITSRALPAVIASGQGFFVKSNAAVSSVNFTELLKTTTQPTSLTTPPLLMGMPVAEMEAAPPGNIYLTMVQDSANYDIAQLRFSDSYKKTFYDKEDAEDLNGSGQTVFFGAMTGDSVQVAITSQPLQKQRTSVYLSVNDNTSGIYTIRKDDLSNIPEVYDVWLLDHFKKDSLDLRANDKYNFNLDKSNPKTFGNGRFEVVIRKKSLPAYQLVSFSGQKAGADVSLRWNTMNEFDYTDFEIQKSTDGVNFEPVKDIHSTSNGTYTYMDVNSATTAKNVFYRLKQTDINDKISFSNVVIISTQGSGSFSVFPNPASNSIQFALKEPVKASVRSNIYNAMGIVVKSGTFKASAGQIDISSLATGSYTIEVIDLDNKKTVLTGKFTKI